MQLLSIVIPLLEEGFHIELNWLGHIVRAIIEWVGPVGLGVIVFTLILKLITTPFDVYQRIKMRKQSLIMRNMKDDLEKLQKQYANDKQTYSMKMMELQKKNGYSRGVPAHDHLLRHPHRGDLGVPVLLAVRQPQHVRTDGARV